MSSFTEKSVPAKQSAPSLGERADAIAAAWADARLVYPLYFYLTTHFHLEIPPVHEPSLPVACPASDLFDRIMQWLDQMDVCVRTNQLRQLLHSLKEIKPESLRAIISRLLHRPEKTPTDRDNIDLLLATYFALCAPEDLYSCEITLADVAQVLRTVLADADSTELEWCVPLDQILEAMKQCHSLREVFSGKLLEKGRELKDASGFMFYDPAALVAFTRFNFLLRRSFFRLLHADLRAIREGLSELERSCISVVDCRSAGLSEQEPVAHLREISLAWRQPISSDYAAGSANRTFEQLLAIRDAVERTIRIASAPARIPVITTVPVANAEDFATAAEMSNSRASAALIDAPASRVRPEKPALSGSIQGNATATRGEASINVSKQSEAPVDNMKPLNAVVASSPAESKPAQPIHSTTSSSEAVEPDAGDDAYHENWPTPASNVPSPQLEECLESIWGQLIEAPPSRGRSMSTVTLGDARILLSAWEVNAFISDSGQLSEDLRRAVAARALVVLAREEQKRSGDSTKLDAAFVLGRAEVTYLQRRVDEAQRMKNTEAAVNLGISARRLLSAIESTQN